MTIQLLPTRLSNRSLWQLCALPLLVFLLGPSKTFAQPGNTCITPLGISALPFDDAGNTSTYGDDYELTDVPPLAAGAITTGTGSNYYLSGDDVVYAYTPSGNQVITITTTNDDDWIGLWAFTGCPFATTVGYHTSISGATRAINNLPVQGGTTYYFVISTWAAPQSTNYTIHIELISVADVCTGTPDPGATTGPLTFCPGVNFTLGLENAFPNSGITFQWETSTDGAIWTNASGASTSATYTTFLIGPTWYRAQVTCAGGGTGTSTPLEMMMNPPNACYCTPTGSTNNTDEILNFSLSDLNNTSAPSEGINGYIDYTSTVAAAHLLTGASYVASLTSGPGSGPHGAAIWIDMDDNGFFEAMEMVTSASSIAASTTAGFPAFTVANAPGIHRLRVQYTYSQMGSSLLPCVINTTYAETEDYLVEIEGSVGIASLYLNSVSVHPNPASTELFITTPDRKPAHIKVFNMTGQLVLDVAMTTHLDVADLAPGSYSLLIADAEGNIQARTRFMKQ